MKNLLYIVLSVLLFSFAANAQSFGKMGVWEVGGSISFMSTTQVVEGETADDSQTDFTLEPYVGYFISDGFELGLIPTFSTSSFGDNSASNFGIFLAPSYNFMTDSNIYPFIEGRVGFNTVTADVDLGGTLVSVDRSGISYGGRAGVKVFVGGNSLINVGLQYMLINLNPEDSDERNGYNELSLAVGWTVFFR